MSQQQKRERNCTHMEFFHCYAKEDPTFDRKGTSRELKRLNQLCRQRTSENALSFDHQTAYPGVICEKPRPLSPERDAEDLLEKDATKRPFTPNPRSTLKHIGRTEKQAMHDRKKPIAVSSQGPANEDLIGNFKNLTLEQKTEIDDLKKVPYDAVCKAALGDLNSLYRADFGKEAKSEECGAYKVPRPVQPETTGAVAGVVQPSRHDLKLAHALSTELKRAETKTVELNTRHDYLEKKTPRYPPIQYGRKLTRPATARAAPTAMPDTPAVPSPRRTPSIAASCHEEAQNGITTEQALALGLPTTAAAPADEPVEVPQLPATARIPIPPTPPSTEQVEEGRPVMKKVIRRPNTARHISLTPNENQIMTNSGYLVEKRNSASTSSPRRVTTASTPRDKDGKTPRQGSPKAAPQSPCRPAGQGKQPHHQRKTRNKKSSHTTNPLKRLAATSAPGINKSVPAVPPCSFISSNPGDPASREKKFVALTKTFFSQQGRFLPYHPTRVNTSGRGQ